MGLGLLPPPPPLLLLRCCCNYYHRHCSCSYAQLHVYLRRAAGRGGDEAAEEHLAHSTHREADAARRACNPHAREAVNR